MQPGDPFALCRGRDSLGFEVVDVRGDSALGDAVLPLAGQRLQECVAGGMGEGRCAGEQAGQFGAGQGGVQGNGLCGVGMDRVGCSAAGEAAEQFLGEGALPVRGQGVGGTDEVFDSVGAKAHQRLSGVVRGVAFEQFAGESIGKRRQLGDGCGDAQRLGKQCPYLEGDLTGLRGGEGPQGGMRGEQAIDRFSGRCFRLQEDVIAAGDGHPFAVRVGFDHHAYAAAALYAKFSGQYDAHAEGLVGTEQRAGPLDIRQQDDRLPAVPGEGVDEWIAPSWDSRVQPETFERGGGHFAGGPAAAIDGDGRRKALVFEGIPLRRGQRSRRRRRRAASSPMRTPRRRRWTATPGGPAPGRPPTSPRRTTSSRDAP